MNDDGSKEHLLIDGDGIEDFLDDFIADMPLEVLEEVRKQDIAAGEDTEIIDKAIRERKRRDEIIRQEQERQEAEQKKWKKIHRRAALYGLLNGLSNSKSNKDSIDTDNLMPWEEDLVKKKEYEPYHFEEEDMEEDDFYYEDD